MPRVAHQYIGGIRWFGLVVTDMRSIFVLELADKTSLGAAAFGIVGAALTAGMQSSPKVYDYQAADPEVLAGLNGSVAILHESIESMQFKSSRTGCRIIFRYRLPGDKERKFDVSLAPTEAYISGHARPDRGRRDAYSDYANEVRALYKRALPLTISMKVEWNQ